MGLRLRRPTQTLLCSFLLRLLYYSPLGYLFAGPYNEAYNISGSSFGSPHFDKAQHFPCHVLQLCPFKLSKTALLRVISSKLSRRSRRGNALTRTLNDTNACQGSLTTLDVHELTHGCKKRKAIEGTGLLENFWGRCSNPRPPAGVAGLSLAWLVVSFLRSPRN